MHTFSQRYDQALALAARAHRDQLRKGTDIPYIAHPVHVSVLLLRHGFGEDLVIAALLHDVVEDCDVPLDLIRRQFGADVGRLVEAVSEQKTADGVGLPWEQRKQAKLAHLRMGGPDVAALKAADALHNAHSVAADLRRDGSVTWAKFKRGAEPTLWYYREILAGARAALGDHPIVTELANVIDDVAALVRDEQNTPQHITTT